MRCNEQHPCCSHCERLNLDCKWQISSSSNATTQKWRDNPTCRPFSNRVPVDRDSHAGSSAITGLQPLPPFAVDVPSLSLTQSSQPLEQIFDYASFMSDSVALWQQQWPLDGLDWSMNLDFQHSQTEAPAYAQLCRKTQAETNGSQLSPASAKETVAAHNIILDTIASNDTYESPDGYPISQLQRGNSVTRNMSQTLVGGGRSSNNSTAEEALLLEYFTSSLVPPILAEVETQQKWSVMRQILISMSNSSAMVKCAIMAFASLLLRRRENSDLATMQDHYARALAQLNDFTRTDAVENAGIESENGLAAIFFLSYVDILEGRTAAVHGHLKHAHAIFLQREKKKFRAIELRLLSWIRLLDARAVSAGGEGLFLSDDEEVLVQPSPSSLKSDTQTRTDDEMPEDDIEDVLFQLLYQPGIIFFQKVQSFMGRISKIDPWHRSRGTVEDETQVMNTAAIISKDLDALYDSRPPLLDFAVAGKLKAPHISPGLACAITRAFRTYASNFYASRIHLHRVAYKNLPLTSKTAQALKSIKQIARLMVENLENDDTLPVSMLWPLLMLGSEEQDLMEREWIAAQILKMEKVATNARLTVAVLQEVQSRQDAAKTRVDIRSVMHAIFDVSFAIL